MLGYWGTIAGAITIGIIATAVTWWLLGPWQGLFMGVLVVAIAVIDVIFGRLKLTFSRAVNNVYRRNPSRFWAWVLACAFTMFLLLLHFLDLAK